MKPRKERQEEVDSVMRSFVLRAVVQRVLYKREDWRSYYPEDTWVDRVIGGLLRDGLVIEGNGGVLLLAGDLDR